MMAMTNGSTILAADLNAMLSTQLALMAADNAQLPVGFHSQHRFDGIVATTPVERSLSVVVVPFDCYVEALIVTTNGMTNPSTVTVSVTGDGALPNFPISTTQSVTAAFTNLVRFAYDGTKGRVGKLAMPTNRAFRVFPRGSTLTVAATTTNVAAGAQLQVAVALRQFFGRD